MFLEMMNGHIYKKCINIGLQKVYKNLFIKIDVNILKNITFFNMIYNLIKKSCISVIFFTYCIKLIIITHHWL